MQREMVTDPVCGLEVNPREAPYSSTFQGRTYYFTDADCKRMFDEDPAAYVGMGAPEGMSRPGGAGSSGSTSSRK